MIVLHGLQPAWSGTVAGIYAIATGVGVAAGAYVMAANIGVVLLPPVMGAIMDAFGGPFKPGGNWAGMWTLLSGYGIGLAVMFAVKEKAVAPAKAKHAVA